MYLISLNYAKIYNTVIIERTYCNLSIFSRLLLSERQTFYNFKINWIKSLFMKLNLPLVVLLNKSTAFFKLFWSLLVLLN